MKLRNPLRILFLGMCLSLAALPVVQAVPVGASATAPVYGPELQGFDYPYPVRQCNFTSQGAALHMAYMDVKAATPNGRTALLMHGKNYCGATWEPTIKALNAAGYRVIAPDQIGFCKSSKPEHYQYTFQQLASNTQALLASLGIERATLVAHSTGGMIAVRYALMFPAQTEQLALVNPIGLEDWKTLGVPSLARIFHESANLTVKFAERVRGVLIDGFLLAFFSHALIADVTPPTPVAL